MEADSWDLISFESCRSSVVYHVEEVSVQEFVVIVEAKDNISVGTCFDGRPRTGQ